MQRVGSGTLRGRVLRALPSGIAGVRPTGSRVREAIFDRLQAEVRGAVVLDLFAGTGALAIEALSRGADRATLVDVQPRVVRFLKEQIRELSLADRAVVWCAAAREFLRSPPIAATPHDLVLLDPPYDETAAQVPALLAALATGGWLKGDALVVCEYERSRGSPPELTALWSREAARTYGQTGVDFLRWTHAQSR
jgi:16S rRNA (guanine966-N2)-methyltransferase